MSVRSSGPDGPSQHDVRLLVLIVVVAGLLITGYVVLAVSGRDTTGYVLLIGGPAMTSIIGAIISHRVRAVAAAVADVQAVAAAVIDDELPAVHRHLEVQDEALAEIAGGILPATPAASVVPRLASPGWSPFPSPRAADPAQSHSDRPV